MSWWEEQRRHWRSDWGRFNPSWLLRPLGVVARLIFFAALFSVWFLFKPDDISQIPFAALTLEMVSKTAFWVLAGVWLGYWLFHPTQDEQLRNAWGWFGVLLCFAGVLGAAAYAMR